MMKSKFGLRIEKLQFEVGSILQRVCTISKITNIIHSKLYGCYGLQPQMWDGIPAYVSSFLKTSKETNKMLSNKWIQLDLEHYTFHRANIHLLDVLQLLQLHPKLLLIAMFQSPKRIRFRPAFRSFYLRYVSKYNASVPAFY